MVLYSEGRNVRPVPLYKERKQGQFPHFAGCYSISEISVAPSFFSKPKESSAPPPIATSITNAVDLPHHLRHGSESREGCEVGRGAAARGAAKGAGNLPPQLAAKELREYYYLFWSTELRAHPRTKVLSAAASELAPNGYPFFALFFYCGLCPPFSEFFCDIMNTYGFCLLDFTPNAVLTMAVFAHLCENFVGVYPNVALFRHFFMPRVERGAFIRRNRLDLEDRQEGSLSGGRAPQQVVGMESRLVLDCRGEPAAIYRPAPSPSSVRQRLEQRGPGRR